MSLDLSAIRKEFPLLQGKAYLNSCSYGLLSRAVENAFQEYLASRHEKGAQWELWIEKIAAMRCALARLLQCETADISISSSLSESVNSLASSVDLSGKRDTVVVTDFDFSTTSHIWLAQQRRGARVVRAQADDSGLSIPLERFDELIDDRTRIVSIPYVCFRNGARLSIQHIVEMAHERGALVFIDGYPAIGTMPLSAPDTGADFLAGGCLKFLLGTAGLAFMYVRASEESAHIPTVTGWFGQENPYAMDIHVNTPARNARRFESGTPSVSALYACAAGINLLLQTGLEAVQAQIEHLNAQIAEGTMTRGWKLNTPTSPGCRGAIMAVASTDAPALVRALAEHDVLVSARESNIRIAPHYYNNDEDIKALFAALERNPALLQPAS